MDKLIQSVLFFQGNDFAQITNLPYEKTQRHNGCCTMSKCVSVMRFNCELNSNNSENDMNARMDGETVSSLSA